MDVTIDHTVTCGDSGLPQAGCPPRHLGATNRTLGGRCQLWHGPDLVGLVHKRPSHAWAWTRPGGGLIMSEPQGVKGKQSQTAGKGGRDRFYSNIATAGERRSRVS